MRNLQYQDSMGCWWQFMLGHYGEGGFYSQSQKANFVVFLVGVHLRKYTCFMVFQMFQAKLKEYLHIADVVAAYKLKE